MSRNRILSRVPVNRITTAVSAVCPTGFVAVPAGFAATSPTAFHTTNTAAPADWQRQLYATAFDEARKLIARKSLIDTLNYRFN